MVDHTEWLLMFVMLHWFQHKCTSTSVINSQLHTDWMGNLSTHYQHISLVNLAIPGSHDSGTYSLSTTHMNLFDNDQFTRYFQMALNSTKKSSFGNLIYRWSKTQDLNITEQLQRGIRYLDLRVAVDGNGTCHIVHRLLGTYLDNILYQVDTFLQNHTKEIILLDVNHVYVDPSISKQKAENAIRRSVFNILGRKLCPCTSTHNCTLNALWKLSCQVLFFYKTMSRNQNTTASICPDNAMVSPFQERVFTQKSTWLRFLDTNYKQRRYKEAFYVTQGIMQPHWMEVAVAGISEKASLKNWVSNDASSEIVKWLASKKDEEHPVNIVIVDFVENHKFIETVLSLNTQVNSGVIMEIDTLVTFVSIATAALSWQRCL